jgi:hypothetical protein
MKSVFMLSVPYEGLCGPAFTTREEAEKFWSEEISTDYGEKIVEVKVRTSAKEDSQ